MSVLSEVLKFVRSIIGPGDTDYGVGWNDALGEVREYVEDQMWERGEDDEA